MKQTKNTQNTTCHSDRSGGIPLDHTVRNGAKRTDKSFISSFFWNLGLKNTTERDTLTSLGMTKLREFSGFTLVELIVVITILTILGTIAFTQLGGFAGSARDSARISNLTNLKKWLDIFQIKSGTYPMPEGTVSIMASGTTIGYQWFAKDQIANIAKLSPGGTQDPSDSTIFTTYAVNQNQTKMQAMVFLEDNSTLTTVFVPNTSSLWIMQASASTTSDYSVRYPITIGDGLGILLDSSTGSTKNQPIQELYNATTFTGVDITNTNSGYVVYFNNTIKETWTGGHLDEAYKTLSVIYNSTSNNSTSNWHTVDNNCWKPDVTVGSQVWAGCNSTIGSTAIAYNNTSTSCYNYAGGTMACTAPPSGKTVSTMTEADYLAGQSANIYGALYQWDTMNTNTCFGTGISASNTTCPCKGGYHLPTQAEWDTLETSLGCSGTDKLTGDTSWWECMTTTTDTTNGLGWTSTNPNSLKNKLGLTLAGYCSSGGSCYYRGYNAYYWSSSAFDASSSWSRYLYYSYASVGRITLAQTSDFSVRCLKD